MSIIALDICKSEMANSSKVFDYQNGSIEGLKKPGE